jgi:hypothetical protein
MSPTVLSSRTALSTNEANEPVAIGASRRAGVAGAGKNRRRIRQELLDTQVASVQAVRVLNRVGLDPIAQLDGAILS